MEKAKVVVESHVEVEYPTDITEGSITYIKRRIARSYSFENYGIRFKKVNGNA